MRDIKEYIAAAKSSFIYPVIQEYQGLKLPDNWKESRKKARELALVKYKPSKELDDILTEIDRCITKAEWCVYVYNRLARDQVAYFREKDL